MKTQIKKATKKVFKWGGASFSVPAQVVGEELEAMSKNGEITAPAVLEAGRDPSNVLHPCFEWDDDKAAEAHRLQQARSLIRSVRVVVTNGDKREKQYAYVHVTDADGPRDIDADRVAGEEDIRAAAIEELLSHLEGVKRRYSFIKELAPIFEAAAKVRRKK